MTPLLIEATSAVSHVVDSYTRDLVQLAIDQLQKLPDYFSKFILQLEQNQTLATCLGISNHELENAYDCA